MPWDIKIQVKQHTKLVLVPCVGGEEGRVYVIQLSCRALHHSCPSQEKFVFALSPPPVPFLQGKPEEALGTASSGVELCQCRKHIPLAPANTVTFPRAVGARPWTRLRAREASPCPRRKALQQGSACPGLCQEQDSLWTLRETIHAGSCSYNWKDKITSFCFLLSQGDFFALLQLYPPGNMEFF